MDALIVVRDEMAIAAGRAVGHGHRPSPGTEAGR